MNQFAKVTLALSSIFLLTNSAYAADTIPKASTPSTFLGPTFRGGFNNNITDWSAFSVDAEVARKNFRIDTTVGVQMFYNQRLKLSAEYLWQDIRYGFATGNTKQWVNQGAVGGLYDYTFCNVLFKPAIGVSGYYAHSPSKVLHDRIASFVSTDGLLTPFADVRRIAGATSYGVAPGISILPWRGGKVGADLNYDHVRYENKHHHHHHVTAKGYGGTIRYDQYVWRQISMNTAAEIRQPFYNYSAGVYWNNIPYYGEWTLGLIGGYTNGKKHLPNTSNVTFSANYAFDQRCNPPCEDRAFQESFLAWTAKPAVSMPQVLAIRDERTVELLPV